jgi:hypothetical protein
VLIIIFKSFSLSAKRSICHFFVVIFVVQL